MAYHVHLTASADLSGQTATLLATLPPGFSYQAGSTFLQDAMDPRHTATRLQWARSPGGPGIYVK